MRNSIELAICIAGAAVEQVAMAQNGKYQGVPVSTTVFITFENGGAVFRPTAEDAATTTSAKDAALVSIRGRTSSGIPTTKDESSALARVSRSSIGHLELPLIS